MAQTVGTQPNRVYVMTTIAAAVFIALRRRRRDSWSLFSGAGRAGRSEFSTGHRRYLERGRQQSGSGSLDKCAVTSVRKGPLVTEINELPSKDAQVNVLYVQVSAEQRNLSS